MEYLCDFLTFKTFISPGVLMAAYLTGAFIVPALVWFFMHRLLRGHPGLLGEPLRGGYNALSVAGKIRLAAFFLGLILIVEILWRMVIEYLVAYLQIRDAVVLFLL